MYVCCWSLFHFFSKCRQNVTRWPFGWQLISMMKFCNPHNKNYRNGCFVIGNGQNVSQSIDINRAFTVVEVIFSTSYFCYHTTNTHQERRRDNAVTLIFTWWRHQSITFSALLALCVGKSPITGEFPSKTPVTQGFDVSFDLRLNKPLSKQLWGSWFETPSGPLWRHCNDEALAICATHTWCYRSWYRCHVSSIHWGRNKVADIFQTTFSNEFSWVKMFEFWL